MLCLLISLCLLGVADATGGPVVRVDAAWEAALVPLWSADGDWEQAQAAEALLSHSVDAAWLYARLSAGRVYSNEVPRGTRIRTRAGHRGVPHPYIALVPESYDPRRRYPVRVILHGSIQRPAWQGAGAWWRRTDWFQSERWITVFPAAWEDSPWWRYSQVENLGGILRELRREYNLDENRAYLMGLSDGGTGTFFHALKATTPWAAFFPFIGHPNVLLHADSDADGQFYAVNLSNKALLIANGETDPLYPAEEVSLYLELFRRAGAEFVYRPQPGGHDVRWWPQERENIEAFKRAHVRESLPDSLVWETDDPERYGRAHWVQIDELGPVIGESPLADPNDLRLPKIFESDSMLAFPRDRASGQIRARREGNTIHVRTRGVRSFRLLLSPSAFDFAREISVLVNGREAFDGFVEPSVRTLVDWWIRDEDRTMLFAAELSIRVPEVEDSMAFDDIPTLADFAGGVDENWSSINDGVMGGLSSGRLRASEAGTGIFEGRVSFENNGGFASVRARLGKTDLSEFTGLEVRFRGDGQRYRVRLRMDERVDGVAYQSRFETADGVWSTVRVPFSRFEASFRGRVLQDAEKLDPARIEQLGFLIADGQEGPFRLEIEWVRPYRGER